MSRSTPEHRRNRHGLGRRPNVLLMVTDDQGAWALGSSMPELHTPALDRLQREGTTLDRFFCASPVCSPARASLMTGRMPSAHGIHDWLAPEALARAGSPEHPVDPDFPARAEGADSLGAMFSRAGYRCGMVGKWHVGSSDCPAEGFEYWYAHQLGGGPYYGAPIWAQEPDGLPAIPAVPTVEPRYLTEAITERSVDFLDGSIGQGADDDRPFFLQVSWAAPHDPWDPGNHPEDLLDLYADTDFPSVPRDEWHPWFVRENFPAVIEDRRPSIAGYCAALSGVDRSIDALRARLEEAGVLDDTIVVFTSDNGFSCGHHGIWGKGNGTWPLNFWEPSIAVPFIARWPGRISVGAVDHEPTSATSLLETLAELAGVEPREDPLRAGRSVASRLCAEAAQEDGAKAPAGEDLGEEAEPIVIHDEYGANRMIRTRRWKLVVRRDGPTELYDLREDPQERRDLSDDPAHVQQLEILRARLGSWFADHVLPGLSGWRVDVDGSGQDRPLG
ncbi:sulfatase-like hydrolase/transferase [Brachybacterium sp. NPDC056505]|uniref:sulfatase-like hydrolase/transferase n=1 Tax=Brachybacterium sp. NPDC056505 TaxID=3345843 RepID=UPI0036711D66